jgi:hypothetical protein
MGEVDVSDQILTALYSTVKTRPAKVGLERLQTVIEQLRGHESSVDAEQATAMFLPPTTTFYATDKKHDLRAKESAARAAFLADVSSDLRILRRDVRERANRAFNFMIIFASISSAAILAAIGLALAGGVPATSLSAIASIISGSAAGAFWKVYHTETRRADELIQDLQKIEAARVAYLLTSSGQGRDNSERPEIKELLRFPREENTS